MTNPNDPLEARLRASLQAHAQQAPDGDLLAERIVHQADQGEMPGHRRAWRTWGLPLVAAGAVGAVVAAMIAIQTVPSNTAKPQPGSSQYHTRVGSPSVTKLNPTSAAPTQVVPAPASTTTVPGATRAPGAAKLHNVRILDLTFAGVNDGWALASAECLHGSGLCTAFLRTTDGQTWHSMPGPRFNVAGVKGCADPCVTDLRFATDQIGYAFGANALFMTTDGGYSWHRQAGGAVALETLAGNVIRVSTQCLPGCPYAVQTAPIGSSTWRTTARIRDPGMSPGVILARTGDRAYLMVLGHTTGGAGRATSALWVSADNGASWSDRGEPCPQNLRGYGEVDSRQLTPAPDGSVTVLCTPRQSQTAWQFTMTSTDGARHFDRGGVRALGTAPLDALAAASAQVIVVSGADGSYRSADGGRHFARLGGDGGSDPGALSWLGFESSSVGRGISTDARTVWTTRDAGQSWTATTFG